ncbi:MAG: hypothetical protein J0M04_20135 [Verrucomicrobia bacterium]|nr:hypothetical protein [Verrucomicrobiota bacterium]
MISPGHPPASQQTSRPKPDLPRAAAREPAPLPLTPAGEAILARAAAILDGVEIPRGERQVRLQVLRAALTGTVIRPSDDSPEMRNPAYWILVNDRFVVAPGMAPVDAISDLWTLHGPDGIPVPRIRCLKYTTLVLIQGVIQHFRETGQTEGLAALNRIIGRKVIPQELPNRGDNILWRRHFDPANLLPGDQVWFDNPFFDRGRELFRQRYHQDALHAGKSADTAAAEARARAEAVTAGEEGSNAFYLGDDGFILGADSLVRAFRGPLRGTPADSPAPHELVFTKKIYSLARFREHMIDDNFSVQACLREDPSSVDPSRFTIERVRAPIDPEHLLRFDALHPPEKSLAELIDAIASSNPPPSLRQSGNTTTPVFAGDYDWNEQNRVRHALDALMRADPDAIWWLLREHSRDNRYVLTASRGPETRNFTVGMICGDLADARLCLCFVRRLPLVPGRLPATFHPEREFLANEAHWHASRMPLFAMQSALCEAAIRDWSSVRETNPGEDGRTHRFSADEKARYTAALRQEIAELARTRRAASEEVILPHLPAPAGWEGYDNTTPAPPSPRSHEQGHECHGNNK